MARGINIFARGIIARGIIILSTRHYRSRHSYFCMWHYRSQHNYFGINIFFCAWHYPSRHHIIFGIKISVARSIIPCGIILLFILSLARGILSRHHIISYIIFGARHYSLRHHLICFDEYCKNSGSMLEHKNNK